MTFSRYFRPDEFPEDPREHAAPDLIELLDDFRRILSEPIYPSPRPGALARFDDEDAYSQHYAWGRKSTAVDVFPAGEPAWYWLMAVSCYRWGAVGFYPETQHQGRRWPMLHLDIREDGEGHSKDMPLLWLYQRGQYLYPQYDPAARGRLLKALG